MRFEVKAYNPSSLEVDWEALQGFQFGAWSTEGIKQADLEELLFINDPVHGRYKASHLDPNSEVSHVPDDGKRFGTNQLFKMPRVYIARDAQGDLAGFSYTAHNTSGGGSAEEAHNDSPRANAWREAKMLSRYLPVGGRASCDYLWFREIVAPQGDDQEEIALSLMLKSLEDKRVKPYQHPKIYLNYLDKERTTPFGYELSLDALEDLGMLMIEGPKKKELVRADASEPLELWRTVHQSNAAVALHYRVSQRLGKLAAEKA